MQINSISSITSFTQNNKQNRRTSNGTLIAAGSTFLGTLATPLIYGNGLKEYQNRNKSKFVMAAVGVGLISGAAKFFIDKYTDKISDEKRRTYLNSVLALSVIPLCLIADYQAAINKNLLKEKNQKFCKTIVNGIKKFLDVL